MLAAGRLRLSGSAWTGPQVGHGEDRAVVPAATRWTTRSGDRPLRPLLPELVQACARQVLGAHDDVEPAIRLELEEERLGDPRDIRGAGEVVATAAGATATIVFTDGSEVKLKAGTSLSIREVNFSTLVEAGQMEKPVGRVIKVLAGEVWSNVIPNPEVATQFETPSGVAAVKGTQLSISVARE